jgi:Divergent InlB B-repeat domain/IPT/TIG domain
MGRFVFRSGGVGLLLALIACLLPAGASALVEPIGSLNYSTETVCGPPPEGFVSCFADGLVPESPAARSRLYPIGMDLAEPPTLGRPSEGVYGLRPEDLHLVYELPPNAPGGQTIGIIEAYDDPTIENDLGVYDEEFGLPSCTAANGCFRKLNQDGNAFPLPAVDARWAADTSLDVETAHAVCHNCDIVLVEAESNSYWALETAMEAAVAARANEVSTSWGDMDDYESPRFDQHGVVITAAAGDWGYDNWEDGGYGIGANYPGSSPYVVSVGGTTLSPFQGSWAGEEAWSHTGSGCGLEPAWHWQTQYWNWGETGCANGRAVADIAADADPLSGVAIYDSTPLSPWFPGWATFGGTGLSSTIIAAAFGLADGPGMVAHPARTIYQRGNSGNLHDIVNGSNHPETPCNGSLSLICEASYGWDGPTGLGTPRGVEALTAFGGAEPTVTGVSPAHGLSMGGQTVEITGTGLAGASAVKFGGEKASIIDDKEDAITVGTPPHYHEIVDVTVVGPDGNVSEVSPADRYEYSALTPVVERVSPSFGPPSGGTEVTIEGTGLAEIVGVEFVIPYYGTVTFVDENEVKVTTPSHPQGTVSLGLFGHSSHIYVENGFTFAAPRYDKLSIHFGGTGQGTVAIAPVGSECSSDCVQGFEDVEGGLPLSLSATPQSGSTFTGWSGGACSGDSFCHFTIGGDTEVTATFEKSPSSVTSGPNPSSNGSKATTAPGGTVPLATGDPKALKACLTAAKKAYRKAARLARAVDSGRAAAAQKAKRVHYKAVVACRRRY